MQSEMGDIGIVDFAQVMANASHLEPVALRVDHAPPGKVIERRPPEHGLFATSIHGNVSANARRFP